MLTGKIFPNMNETTIAINGLSRDLTDMAQTLAAIHDRHKDKQGEILNVEENELVLDCFQDYHEISTRLSQLTMAPMLTITEALTEVARQEKAEAPVKFTQTGDIIGEAVVVKEGSK